MVEVPEKQYGVPVTSADEEKLAVALGLVCQSEIDALLTANDHILALGE